MKIEPIDDKHLTGIKLTDNIVSSQNDVVGSFIKNTAEIEIININHQYDYLKGTYLKIPNFGTWYVNEIEHDEEFINSTLKLYDITKKFDEDYEDTFQFPATLLEWAKWVGEKVGVPLKEEFFNCNFTLTERPYLSQTPTYRDAIKVIAKYACGYAQKNYDDTFSIKWFDDTIAEIEDWLEFKHGNTTSQVNVLVLGSGDTNDNVKWPEETPESPYELRIDDDWNNIDRYSLLEPFFNHVKGFSYTSISKLEIPYGVLNLRAGQKIKTKDIENKDIETYITSVEFEWSGGILDDNYSWLTTVKMDSLQETSTALKYTNSFENKILEVIRQADKNNGKIEDLIKETTSNENKISKVEQDVDSISQEVSNTKNQVEENYTKILQDVENIINQVQNSGGSNMILNSVMFAVENGIPSNWDTSGTGTLTTSSSPESLGNGCISGHVFTLNDLLVKQRISVRVDSADTTEEDKNYYTFTCKLKKSAVGNAYIKIYNEKEEYLIEIPQGDNIFYKEYSIKGLLPKMNYYDIELYGSLDSKTTFTDVMFALGRYKTQWTQASGEIMNTQVNINVDGVLVKSSVYEGDYTIMSPLEFAGYSKINGIVTKVFSLNKDTTIVKKMRAEDEITMHPIKIVPITSGNIQGWGFVPSTGGGR